MFWNKKNVVTRFLPIYDIVVNDFNCRYVWKCEKNHIFNLYKQNISKNHLEIGPGTGYFLKNYSFSNLSLMDVNEDTLSFSKNQLKPQSKKIQNFHHDIFKQKIYVKDIDSVGVNYVLHCVDGKLEDKLDTLVKNLITDRDVIIFGASVVSENIGKNKIAEAELYFLNQMNIFHNQYDCASNAIRYFERNKTKHKYNVIGNVFLFSFLKKKHFINEQANYFL